jgi:predicted amidophosphoribosyltransferase
MAHYKCVACRARLPRDGASHDLCPICGEPLQRVARAEDLIGLPSLGADLQRGALIADHIRATIARNDAARREWQDGDGGKQE